MERFIFLKDVELRLYLAKEVILYRSLRTVMSQDHGKDLVGDGIN